MGLEQTVVVVFLGLVTAVNYLRFRDVLYPPVLQAGVWTGILFFYFLNDHLLLPLSGLLYAVVGAGVVLFSTGAYLATRTHRSTRAPIPFVAFEAKPWYAALLFWGPLLGLVPFLLTAFQLGQEGPFDNVYRNIRLSVFETEDQTAGGRYGVLSYLLPLAYVSVGLQTLLGGYRTDRGRFWISVLVALLYSVFFSGRTNLMFLLVMTTGILLITRRVSAWRTFAAVSLGGLVVFAGFGWLVGQVAGTDAGFGEVLISVRDLLVLYGLGSLPAFDGVLHTELARAWGANTFRSFFALLANLGFEVPVRPLVQPYEFVPFPTNVYSVYQPYFSDFAFWGIGFIQLAAGCVHGFLYRKAGEGHLFFVMLYALALYPLFMQFFQDQYFSLLSLWVQYGVLLFLFFYRVRVFDEPAARS